ncbi:hypothetical protein J6590_090615 [Homalodisca vitripennis]|nr:hypothetical protein J6590_090615 [Homalodisca vitripennis]
MSEGCGSRRCVPTIGKRDRQKGDKEIIDREKDNISGVMERRGMTEISVEAPGTKAVVAMLAGSANCLFINSSVNEKRDALDTGASMISLTLALDGFCLSLKWSRGCFKRLMLVAKIKEDCAILDRDISVDEKIDNGVVWSWWLEQFPALIMNVNDYGVTLKKVHWDASQWYHRWCSRSGQLKLMKKQGAEVRDPITKYQDVFEIRESPKGKTTIILHAIEIGDAKFVRQNSWRLPLSEPEEARKVINEMENVSLVKIKDRTLEFCVNYWVSNNATKRYIFICLESLTPWTLWKAAIGWLNNATKRDIFHLPRIVDTLDSLEGRKLEAIGWLNNATKRDIFHLPRIVDTLDSLEGRKLEAIGWLNNATKRDIFHLPRIVDTLDSLEGRKLFSTLDLKTGYWQVGSERQRKDYILDQRKSLPVARDAMWSM